jgi:hypothetical protein
MNAIAPITIKLVILCTTLNRDIKTLECDCWIVELSLLYHGNPAIWQSHFTTTYLYNDEIGKRKVPGMKNFLARMCFMALPESLIDDFLMGKSFGAFVGQEV